MQRRRIGESGLEVGWLGLAPAPLLRHPDELGLAVDALLDAGGDLISVSTVASERSSWSGLADLLTDTGRRRRCRLNVRSDAVTRGTLLSELDGALGTLDVDAVDLWTLTAWADSWEELATAANVALASGRVHYVAVALPHAWQDVLVASAIRSGPPGARVAAIAAPYSLVDRTAETDLMPATRALGAGFIAGAPLGHGILTGKYRHGTPPDSRGASESHGPTIRRLLDGTGRHVVDGVAAAAEGLATSPATVALAWLRDAPDVSAVVASARTIHQWRGLLGSDGVVLPQEIRSALNDVSAA